jgi:pimeloyl-ACP methyl ester carboxylesterase
MLAVHGVLPDTPNARPPIVLVHGAANSAAVWTFWQRMLAERGWASYAVDLRGHGASTPCDLSRTTMQDYTDDVVSVARTFTQPPIFLGWSMGGLVAMMAAAECGARAVVGLAPSTPAAARNPDKVIQHGEFGPEEYGITPDDADEQPAMPDLDREERAIALASLGRESRWARGERAAGIVIECMPCALLIVTGTADRQWPRERYDGMPLPSEHLRADGSSHWGLVLNRRTLATLVPRVIEWIERRAQDAAKTTIARRLATTSPDAYGGLAEPSGSDGGSTCTT